MNQSPKASATEFELTVEEVNDARPLPGFHVTRTRTFFVDNCGQVYVLSAPGHRAMLQRADELPADAEPTRAIDDPGLRLMARAAQSLGRGSCELGALHIADYYTFSGRVFRIRQDEIFELTMEFDPYFVAVSALPAGALPLSEAEAEQLGKGVHTAKLPQCYTKCSKGGIPGDRNLAAD